MIISFIIYHNLTFSQTKDCPKISIIDGLHRCFALLRYFTSDEHGATWQKLKNCKRTVLLKMFVLKKKFRKQVIPKVIPKLLKLLKDYSFEIFEQRKATVGHTFFDALRNTLMQERLNGTEFKYLTVQSDTSETKQFFSRPAKQRKAHLIEYYKSRMINIHLTMCKSEQYLSLLTDKAGQIVKDSTVYLKTFNIADDKVSIEFVVSVCHMSTKLTIVFCH